MNDKKIHTEEELKPIVKEAIGEAIKEERKGPNRSQRRTNKNKPSIKSEKIRQRISISGIVPVTHNVKRDRKLKEKRMAKAFRDSILKRNGLGKEEKL